LLQVGLFGVIKTVPLAFVTATEKFQRGLSLDGNRVQRNRALCNNPRLEELFDWRWLRDLVPLAVLEKITNLIVSAIRTAAITISIISNYTSPKA
jgi:hypothetical protein